MRAESVRLKVLLLVLLLVFLVVLQFSSYGRLAKTLLARSRPVQYGSGGGTQTVAPYWRTHPAPSKSVPTECVPAEPVPYAARP